ncbi:hypothetical protein [Eubacterium oxidoreducens]|uniref:Uncharacterized protein n=1 Tax=Eubacterium oxidoreducens TaxID=1732 RepID=A0A1G6BX87_EUBOX|nr:hypothetical protein [Eubacterium oxidoreducens]SDB25167.1 hypothetical protein SAMN02910417_01868 [Eubacterium oxidoreducens]
MFCEQGDLEEVGLNLADLNLKYWHQAPMLEQYLKELRVTQLAMGSNFCDIYFAKTLRMLEEGWERILDSLSCKLTLVVPQLGEGMLSRIERQLMSCLFFVSEIVVNDIAMLAKVSAWKSEGLYRGKITAGRLLIKNFRDARYEQYTDSEVKVFFPVYLEGKVDAVELEYVAQRMNLTEIPSGVEVVMHYPYTYQTCSGACSYAAAANPKNLYFQQNQRCKTTCMAGYLKLEEHFPMYLVGRGVYIQAAPITWMSKKADRYWYWPVDYVLGLICIMGEDMVAVP